MVHSRSPTDFQTQIKVQTNKPIGSKALGWSVGQLETWGTKTVKWKQAWIHTFYNFPCINYTLPNIFVQSGNTTVHKPDILIHLKCFNVSYFLDFNHGVKIDFSTQPILKTSFCC